MEGRYYGNESALSDKADETDPVLSADRRRETCNGCRCFFKEQGITIGTTTVYRNLEKMVEQGMVAKYNVDGTSSACFEYLGAEEHCHKTSCFHCKCEKCGKLIHLHCEDVVKLEQHLMDSHGFQMDPCRTVFYGICEECRSAEDEASETVHMKAR